MTTKKLKQPMSSKSLEPRANTLKSDEARSTLTAEGGHPQALSFQDRERVTEISQSQSLITELIKEYEFGERRFLRLDLAHQDLSGIQFSEANLKGTDFSFTQLRCVNFKNCDLRGVNLRSSNLSGANLANADLRGANLTDCYLKDANLRGANLSGALFERVICQKTQLRNCILPDNTKWDFRHPVSETLTKESLKKLYEKRLNQRKKMANLISVGFLFLLIQSLGCIEFIVFHVLNKP